MPCDSPQRPTEPTGDESGGGGEQRDERMSRGEQKDCPSAGLGYRYRALGVVECWMRSLNGKTQLLMARPMRLATDGDRTRHARAALARVRPGAQRAPPGHYWLVLWWPSATSALPCVISCLGTWQMFQPQNQKVLETNCTQHKNIGLPSSFGPKPARLSEDLSPSPLFYI